MSNTHDESHDESRRQSGWRPDEKFVKAFGDGRLGRVLRSMRDGSFWKMPDPEELRKSDIQKSIAHDYPDNMPDREIAEDYRRRTLAELADFRGRKAAGAPDGEMAEHLELEVRAIDELLRRKDESLPELHAFSRWVQYITELEWRGMTPEERKDTSWIDRLIDGFGKDAKG